MVASCVCSCSINRVCCIGAGYVGGPTSAVMASKCPDVQFVVVDTDKDRIDAWNSDKLPVYEPGLDAVVRERRGINLHFSVDIPRAIRQADVVFVAVSTPALAQSSSSAGAPADLRSIEQCARWIAESAEASMIVVEKSTVPCGTGATVASMLESLAKPGVSFHVLSNPEFLSEGTAVSDLSNPDRVIIGGMRGSEQAQQMLKSLYAQWVPGERIVTMDLWSAELVKLASNAMLAQRISSINAISAVCERAGADIAEVARGCGMDSRIGSRHLRASVGFGGSCFHKDVSSLVWLCDSIGLPEVAEYWRQVLRLNSFQISRFTSAIAESIVGGVEGKHVACLGFAYKGGTDDTRNTPAGQVCRDLLSKGATLSIYDPKVPKQHVLEKMGSYEYEPAFVWQRRVCISHSIYEAAKGAHAVVVLTAWPEFLQIDWSQMRVNMRKPAYVFDGQVMLDQERLRDLGFCVYTIGKASGATPL